MAVIQRPVCVSVINMKGGVGKTTVAALLSRHASQNHGRNVLAIDLDPQANLSQALMAVGPGYRRFLDDNLPSIVDIFRGYRPPTGSRPAPSPLDPTSTAIEVEPNLRLIPSRFDFSDNLIDSIRPDPRVLAQIVSHYFQDQELIFIDCAPTESILTQAAYHTSRYILVPVRPEYFATIGFPLLKDSISKFRRSNPTHRIDVIGIVINNSSYHYSGNRGGPERETSIKEIRAEAKTSGWFMFEHELPLSRGFPKMMRGDFHYLGDAELFRYFAEEFFDRLYSLSGFTVQQDQ